MLLWIDVWMHMQPWYESNHQPTRKRPSRPDTQKKIYPEFCTMKETIDEFEHMVGEGGVRDCIWGPSLD